IRSAKGHADIASAEGPGKSARRTKSSGSHHLYPRPIDRGKYRYPSNVVPGKVMAATDALSGVDQRQNLKDLILHGIAPKTVSASAAGVPRPARENAWTILASFLARQESRRSCFRR